jgi:hypothetical protein
MDDMLLADVPCLDPVYVDGVAGVLNLGDNFGTVFFRFVPVKQDNGLIAFQRTPTLYMIRPTNSLEPNDPIRSLLAAQPVPGRTQFVLRH